VLVTVFLISLAVLGLVIARAVNVLP